MVISNQMNLCLLHEKRFRENRIRGRVCHRLAARTPTAANATELELATVQRASREIPTTSIADAAVSAKRMSIATAVCLACATSVSTHALVSAANYPFATSRIIFRLAHARPATPATHSSSAKSLQRRHLGMTSHVVHRLAARTATVATTMATPLARACQDTSAHRRDVGRSALSTLNALPIVHASTASARIHVLTLAESDQFAMPRTIIRFALAPLASPAIRSHNALE